MTTDEFDALKSSIAGRGQDVPVISDQDGETIDGHHREKACDELGIDCLKEVRQFATEAEKYETALRLNCRRRQLNRRQKNELIAAYLKHDPAIADNHLAEIIGGVSKNTVSKVRKGLERTGQIDKLKTLRGKDGKERPRRYKKIIANTPKEAEIALRVISDLPDECEGKTLDITTAKRRAARQTRRDLLSRAPASTEAESKPIHAGRTDIFCGDCLDVMAGLQAASISVVVSSPPYNINVGYTRYKDNRPEGEYLEWLADRFKAIHRVLRDDGSFFVNVGSSRLKPWTAMRVAGVAGRFFQLQNEIIWAKSLSLNGRTHGHFRPIPGDHYLNHNFEHIFHFTKAGNVKLDRLAIGVEYNNSANLLRNNAQNDRRCNGDVWFIPRETVTANSKRGWHPAVFPVELPERCIRLHGVKDDCIVLDPFCGTGSTLLAAARLGVRAIGVEIDPWYCKFAHQRLSRCQLGERRFASKSTERTPVPKALHILHKALSHTDVTRPPALLRSPLFGPNSEGTV